MSRNILSNKRFYPIKDIPIIDFSPVAEIPVSAKDISRAQDGSVVAFLDGVVMRVCATDGEKVFFPSDSSKLFNSPIIQQILGLENVDTSSVTDMSSMFWKCDSLTKIDGIENWDISNTTDINYMFSHCHSLKSLNLNGWDTSSVTDMHGMFYMCESLQSLDIGDWNTSNITDMHNMFSKCTSLTSLDLSTWDTSKVTKTYHMFANCKSLKSLNLSGWDTSNIADMFCMFNGCRSLESLDLSRWDTSNVTNIQWMFYDCDTLKKVVGNKATAPAIIQALKDAGINTKKVFQKAIIPHPTKIESVLSQAKEASKEQDSNHGTLDQKTEKSPKSDR